MGKKGHDKDQPTIPVMVTRGEARILVDNMSAQDPRTRKLHGRVMRALVADEERADVEQAIKEMTILTSPRKKKERQE